jgi:serine/threonine protein phosphatase PrpC
VTEDHTAKNVNEIASLIHRGGSVVEVDGALRVQGELIVTRALGDTALGPVISPNPDTGQINFGPAEMNIDVSKRAIDSCSRYFHRLQAWSTSCRREDGIKSAACPQPNDVAFAILASDGLWDVMSDEDASDMVCSFLLEHESMESYWNSRLLDIDTSDRDDLAFLEDDEVEVAGIFQRASRLLAYEALLRGSLDNIGVSVIDLAFT